MLHPGRLSPITKRILIGFLLSSTVVLVSTTILKLSLDYRASVARTQLGIDMVFNFTLLPAGRALWNYDLKQLEAEMRPAAEMPLIVKVEVLDERDQVVLTVVRPGDLPPVEDVVARPIPGPDQVKPIGTLKLSVSNARARADFWQLARRAVLMEFFGVALLGSLLFYLLHRNVITNLLGIVQGLKQLELHDPSLSLALPRPPHAVDEFDQLIAAINAFRREIIDERQARQKMELESRSLGNELARMGRVATVQSLTSTIAHELNQPLAAILTNAETIELSMLEQLAADDPLREVLADIASEARRAGAIIRNLRSLMEKRDIDTSVLSVNPLVQQVMDLVSLDARWESTRIELQLAPALPPVMGSAVQLQQVILNLVANARDAIEQAGVGAGVIVIKTEQQDSRWLRVSVIDNGPGVAPEKIDYILRPFFTTKDGGTGMGLWIAQMIIEQHGGKLEVGASSGHGARISFTLPVPLS